MGGPEVKLIEMRRFASGVWAVVLLTSPKVPKFIKIPDRVRLTFEEHGFIGAGPISKIKERDKESLEPYPYYPKINGTID